MTLPVSFQILLVQVVVCESLQDFSVGCIFIFLSCLEAQLQLGHTRKNKLISTSASMANTDLEWDGIASQAPRPTDNVGTYHSSSISSESSESISETNSLLGKDNKQAGTYGATEIHRAEPEVIAETDGTTVVLRTPKAIAAVIGVLLVGEDSSAMLAEISY